MALYKRDIECFSSNVRPNGLERERARRQREKQKEGKMRWSRHKEADLTCHQHKDVEKYTCICITHSQDVMCAPVSWILSVYLLYCIYPFDPSDLREGESKVFDLTIHPLPP